MTRKQLSQLAVPVLGYMYIVQCGKHHRNRNNSINKLVIDTTKKMLHDFFYSVHFKTTFSNKKQYKCHVK